MQYNYVLGQEYPIFVIKNLEENEVDRIALDLCGPDGLEVKEKTVDTVHELLCGTTEVEREGTNLEFALSYVDYSPRENSQKINKIRKYFSSNNYEVTLIPFSDLSYWKFVVNDITDELVINNMKNGINAIGNRGIVLKYSTKYLQQEITWPDPNWNTISGTYKYPYVGVLSPCSSGG